MSQVCYGACGSNRIFCTACHKITQFGLNEIARRVVANYENSDRVAKDAQVKFGTSGFVEIAISSMLKEASGGEETYRKSREFLLNGWTQIDGGLE